MIKIYSSNFLNNQANCLYPKEIEVNSIEDFKKAVIDMLIKEDI